MTVYLSVSLSLNVLQSTSRHWVSWHDRWLMGWTASLDRSSQPVPIGSQPGGKRPVPSPRWWIDGHGLAKRLLAGHCGQRCGEGQHALVPGVRTRWRGGPSPAGCCCGTNGASASAAGDGIHVLTHPLVLFLSTATPHQPRPSGASDVSVVLSTANPAGLPRVLLDARRFVPYGSCTCGG